MTVRDINARPMERDAELTAGKRYIVFTETGLTRVTFQAELENVAETFEHVQGDVWSRVTRWDNGVTITESSRGRVRFQQL